MLFSDTSRKQLVIGFTLILTALFILLPSYSASESDPNVPTNESPEIVLTFFTNPLCDLCAYKHPVIEDFADTTANVSLEIIEVDWGVDANRSYFFDYFEALNYSTPAVPIVVFNRTGCIYIVQGEAITSHSLREVHSLYLAHPETCPTWDEGQIPADLSFGFIFFSGVISGLSPCILLITGVLSSTVLSDAGKDHTTDTHEKDYGKEPQKGLKNEDEDPEPKSVTPMSSKNEEISASDGLKSDPKPKRGIGKFLSGFVIGILLVYILVSVLIMSTLEVLAATFFGFWFRFIFAALLVGLGLWYVIDAWNENSRLFSTPPRFKEFFKKLINLQSFKSAFLLGLSFSIIKLPCVGAILMALLLNFTADPGYYLPRLVVYFTGVLTPIIVLVGLFLYGYKFIKVEKIRKKYRPWLRAISGLLLIGIALWALLF